MKIFRHSRPRVWHVQNLVFECMRSRIRLYVALGAIAALAGCRGIVDRHVDSTVTPVVCLDDPTVTPAAATLFPGTLLQLTANIYAGRCGSPRAAVTWSSSNPNIATVDAASGLVTAMQASGTVTIAAAAIAAPDVKGAAIITVMPFPAIPTVTIATINTVTGTSSAPANLGAMTGTNDVSLNVDGFAAPRSASLIVNNGVSDTTVATVDAPAGVKSWAPTLRWDTAARRADGRLVFPNGSYTLRAIARDSLASTSTTTITFNASSTTIKITLANP